MERGYIKIWRKLLDWKYINKPNCVAVWLCILLNASHKKHKNQYGDIVLPGQLSTTYKQLAALTGLNPHQVRRVILNLKSVTQIVTLKKQYCLIITINNWDSYNKKPTPTVTLTPKNRHSELAYPLIHKKKNNDHFFLHLVEKIYAEHYPRKVGKKKGLSVIKNQIKTEKDLQRFEIAVINYKKDCNSKKTEDKFIKHFSSFCNKDVWVDYIDYKPKRSLEDEVF